MKYTIIIPVFNSNETINRLLSTIPDRRDIQVIIIDDRSECDYNFLKFKNSKFEYAVNNGIKGAGSSRNVGLALAKGKWLLFADSDDVFLESAFDYFDLVCDEDSDIIYFKSTSLDEKSKKISDRHLYLVDLVDKNLKFNDQSLRYMYFPPWGKLIKSELVVSNSIFFDEVIAANDVMFSLKSGYYANSVLSVDNKVYCVYKSSNSLTNTKTLENRRSRLKVALDRNSFLFEKGLMRYQFSFYSIIYNYGGVFTFHLFFRFLKSCVLLKQRIVPNDISISKIKSLITRI